jgi:hypothetical protein
MEDTPPSDVEARVSLAAHLLEQSSGLVELVSQLHEELGRAGGAGHRVALLNEATSEFESRLGFGRVGSIGWRVCVASGVGWGCFVIAENLAVAASCFGSGLVGGVLTWNLGRMADSSARTLRERWNGLIRRARGSFPQSETFGDRPLTMQCEADERG